MTGFGGSRRERSSGRGAGSFQPETWERDGGRGVQYGTVVKREGDPVMQARGAWWSYGGREGGGVGGRHRTDTDGDGRRGHTGAGEAEGKAGWWAGL
jgi:hypothetical protein